MCAWLIYYILKNTQIFNCLQINAKKCIVSSQKKIYFLKKNVCRYLQMNGSAIQGKNLHITDAKEMLMIHHTGN